MGFRIYIAIIQQAKISIFWKNNIDKFKILLDQTDFSYILQFECPNNEYNEFIKL